MSSGRYARNSGVISAADQERLGSSTVAIVGLGGLGGYCAEQLARLGAGTLVLIDPDRVEETNLNRQILATDATAGAPKARAARERLLSVNPLVEYRCHEVRLDASNAAGLLAGADIAIDALDNVPDRLVLQEACASLEIPLIHGAIAGWYGQVAVVMPGDDTLTRLYPGTATSGLETSMGTPAFTPGVVASLQVAEAVKYLLGMGDVLARQVLYVDLLAHEYLKVGLD